jgi:hypothetical protein
LRQSYGVSATKVVCCGPCQSDPITAQFSTTKTGYVPGEAIEFRAQINNRSNREIDTITVSLLQRIRFHAKNKSKMCTRNVASVGFSEKISQKSEKSWNNGRLVIPPVCSSFQGSTCRIIDLNYSLVLQFETSGITASKNLSIPIVKLLYRCQTLLDSRVKRCRHPMRYLCLIRHQTTCYLTTMPWLKVRQLRVTRKHIVHFILTTRT